MREVTEMFESLEVYTPKQDEYKELCTSHAKALEMFKEDPNDKT